MARYSLLNEDTDEINPWAALVCAMLKSAAADLSSSRESTRRSAIAFWEDENGHLTHWGGLLGLSVEALQRMVEDDLDKAIASLPDGDEFSTLK